MTKEDLLMTNEDGIKLKFIRNNMGLSVAEFSEKTEINPSFINLLEKGYLPLSPRDKRKISEVFELQENWFEAINTNNFLQTIDLNTVEKNINQYKCEEVNHTLFNEDKQVRTQKLAINNGDSLKSTRIAVGLTRKEIAEAIGITSVQIGYIETGKRSLTEKVKNKLNDYFKNNSIISNNTFEKEEEIVDNTLNDVEQDTETLRNSISNDEILNKIRMIKKENGYTQSVVSEKSGVNRSQLSLIENDKMQISKKVKVKLLNFISSELESINYNSENALSEKTTECRTSLDVLTTEQIESQEIISDDIVTDRYELIKVIESMKKTRDELIENINMLEKVLKNM